MLRRILMIDDDRLQFRLAQAHFGKFQGEHYELEWQGTYEDGLARLLSGDYAACLLDFQLGPKDGLQLIREAVAAGCRTPIVFLTAESSHAIDVEAMNAGALDYLVKGEISPKSLERSIRYALKLGETLAQLHRLATRDELTGLLNRREFDRILSEESDRALRFGTPLSLIMCDIDFFKKINDTQGHQGGDYVLREVARRLEKQIRSVDRVARFGGEEFALILVQSDSAGGLPLAERLREVIRATPFEVGGPAPIPVTMSLGIASIPAHAANASELLLAADRALYLSKSGGRNRVTVAAGR